jgi:hypothetical protein
VESTKKAAKIWKRAVELGSLDAMPKLAFLYATGDGVKLNKKKAIELYRFSADRGVVHAQYLLSKELDAEFIAYADAEIAKFEATPARERREIDEDALMARLYADRQSIVKEVYRYARLSAEQGFIPAMRAVGICYGQGHGVERDVDEARRWLDRAFAAGDAGAAAALETLELDA